MKKSVKVIISFFITVLFLFCFVSCDGENNTVKKFTGETIDGVTALSDGNSGAPDDLVNDSSGKISFNTPVSEIPFSITINCDGFYGELTADKNSAKPGNEVTLTYDSKGNKRKIKSGSVKINDAAINGMTFAMPAQNVTVTAEEIACHDISVSDNIINGTVNADKNSYGETETTVVTLTVAPASGYRLKENSLNWNGNTVAADGGGYSFTVPSDETDDVTIYAEFEKLPPEYAVNIGGDVTGGAVTADKATAEAGETVTVTVTPDDGNAYKSGTLKYNGEIISETGENAFTFVMPAKDVTITAEFDITYNIRLNAFLSYGDHTGTDDSDEIIGAAISELSFPSREAESNTINVILRLKSGFSVDYFTAYDVDGNGNANGLFFEDFGGEGEFRFVMPASDVLINLSIIKN